MGIRDSGIRAFGHSGIRRFGDSELVGRREGGEAREGWGVGGVECGTVREDWAWSFWWRRAGAKTVTLGGNKILTGINSPEQ